MTQPARIVVLGGGFAGVSTAQELTKLLRRQGRLATRLDWALELFLAHDVVEINMRRSRTRPGEEVGEVTGEPVSVGVRSEAPEERVV